MTHANQFINENVKNNVLIIDDSDLNLTILTDILSPYYNIYTAKNGIDGIESAKNHQPDIIILDIILPGMDGYETITVIKNDVKIKKIPVIFITGLTDTKEEEKGLAMGGADYITKPFSPEIVKLRVGNQIRMLEYINEIERMSMNDVMTGLPNRRSFDERLSMEWKRALRIGHPISILVIDIDFFKKYNDTHGHLNGDIILREVAKAIKQTTNRPGDFTARWGGEEFIVLLPDTDSKGAAEIAEQIRKNIENTRVILNDGSVTRACVSVGVNTHVPNPVYSIDKFIHYADDALYSAKANGRNQICVSNKN